MKTQIIQLEPHDDLISVKDKMSWAQAARIVLLWPEKGERILERELDLLMLLRHSAELGTQLALVTHDSEVLFYARRLGIPVFKDTHAAHNERWRRRRRKTPRTSPLHSRAFHENREPTDIFTLRPRKTSPAWHAHPAWRVGAFTLGVMAVLAIAAVLFPRAEITLNPQTQTQQVVFTAFTSPTITEVNPSGAVPMHQLSVIVEGRKTIATSGSVELPRTSARGQVQFTNLTTEAITIPAGTVVRTTTDPPVRFITTEEALLPAGVEQTVEVPILALQPGSQGNLRPGTIQAVEGNLGALLSVHNARSTRGGSETSLPAPNQNDRRRVASRLRDELEQSARAELQSLLNPGDLLLTPIPILVSTLQEKYTPAEMTPSDLLEVQLQLEFQGFAIRQEDLLTLARQVLNASLSTGFKPLDSTPKVELITQPTLGEEHSTRWEMRVSRRIVAELDTKQAITLTLGKPLQRAGELLTRNLPLQSTAHIQVTPRWWPWLPVVPFRILIQAETHGA
jgi:hypothetical protein